VTELGGTIAGSYRLDALLGQGGYGTVFRAFDLRLQRPVALKLLNTTKLDQAGRARFMREADLAKRLGHPNTVRLLDFGTDSDAPFIVYELLTGLTLRQACARGPLPDQQVAKIASQVLRSLMEAHALGIVHRDIKPANVMLCDFAGEPDFVKVLDFGIAKNTVANSTKLTAEDSIIGSPRYMAPEQARGEPVGPATDLYTLGLVMAEALEGRQILQGSVFEILAFQASDAPLPLPPRVTGSRLGAVVRRATEKIPARRYSDAGAMLAELTCVSEAGRTPPLPPASGLSPDLSPTVDFTSAPLHPPATPPVAVRRFGGPATWALGVLVAFGLALLGMFAACGSCVSLALLEPGVEAVVVTRPFASDKVRQRLTDENYAIIEESHTRSTTLYKANGPALRRARIAIETHPDPQAAKRAADVHQTGGYSVALDGGRLLAARVEDDAGVLKFQSEQLLERLAKP
jgi:hypothetical protein